MSKRKDDDAFNPAPAKKARGNTANAANVALVNSILANPKSYPISGSEDVVRYVVDVVPELLQVVTVLRELSTSSVKHPTERVMLDG